MLIAFEYIKYLLESKKRHGVHSPFIYDLTDKCFLIQISNEDQLLLKQFDERNSSNQEVITITDHGAGSKRMSNERKVSNIFKTSSSRGKYGELLYRLTAHYKPEHILELGTSLGTGTSRLHLGNPDSQIITVEGCPSTAEIAKRNFENSVFKNITLVNSTFDKFIDELYAKEFDLIFIDGHHDGDALIHYLNRLLPFTHNDSLIILDDIRWSESMFKAWQQISQREDFHVSIDLFRMGIILPRHQQVKEHFVIRM